MKSLIAILILVPALVLAGGRHKERYERNAPDATTASFTCQEGTALAPLDWSGYGKTLIADNGDAQYKGSYYYLWNGSSRTSWHFTQDDASLSPGTGNFTVALSIKANIYNYTKIARLIENYGTGSGFYTMVFQTNERLAWIIRDTGANLAPTSGVAGLVDNTWHHVALVRIGTSIYGYVDGVHVKTATNGSLANVDTVNGTSCFIGSSRFLGTYERYFGNVSKILFVKRALSADEIMQLSEHSKAEGK